jgi:hypothetical protein
MLHDADPESNTSFLSFGKDSGSSDFGVLARVTKLLQHETNVRAGLSTLRAHTVFLVFSVSLAQ